MNIARIRLRKPRRVLTFSSGEMILHRDDNVIVETEQGLEWGICVLPPEPCSPEMERRITMRVVRKATAADEDSYRTIDEEEDRAKELCRKRIQKRGLQMHLVDVQYTFDRHKVTFYFTAENRVDFRDLVRDLARELHSRIELRHIQVRDRSKLIGGLGCCGRNLCCTSWLEGFVPISMRMAKCQNLSLNPNKISGQCGRLLCCLNYENEVYERGDLKPAKFIPMGDDFVDERQLAAIADEGGHSGPSKSFVVKAPRAPEEGPGHGPGPGRGDARRAPEGDKKKKRNKKRKKKPAQGPESA